MIPPLNIKPLQTIRAVKIQIRQSCENQTRLQSIKQIMQIHR